MSNMSTIIERIHIAMLIDPFIYGFFYNSFQFKFNSVGNYVFVCLFGCM